MQEVERHYLPAWKFHVAGTPVCMWFALALAITSSPPIIAVLSEVLAELRDMTIYAHNSALGEFFAPAEYPGRNMLEISIFILRYTMLTRK